jgi:hypothetical protein
MKFFAAITFAAILAGCSTAEMVTYAQGKCNAIGYAPGTAQHTECTERGYRGQAAAQADVIGTFALWALIEAAY